MSDEQLILLFKKNPSKGIEVALQEYGPLVKWITMKIINHSQEDIEECISDVFLRLWQSIDRFDPSKNASLKNYLCGIARHTALDYSRKLSRRGKIVSYDTLELADEIDFMEEISNNFNARLIDKTINELPPPDKEIFIYRFYFFEKISDIAARLSLSPKAVENKLFRGKEKLKKKLMQGGINI